MALRRGHESATCIQALRCVGMTTALTGKHRLRMKKLGLRTWLKKPSSTQGRISCALSSTREPATAKGCMNGVGGRTFSCLHRLQMLSPTQRSAREKKLSSTQSSTRLQRRSVAGRGSMRSQRVPARSQAQQMLSCLHRLRCQPSRSRPKKLGLRIRLKEPTTSLSSLRVGEIQARMSHMKFLSAASAAQEAVL